jgi:murein DD-endopeptidase MepM/ murein hydrolase activator NlpD
MKHHYPFLSAMLLVASATLVAGLGFAFAHGEGEPLETAAVEDESVSGEINDLNKQISNKRSSIDTIRRDIAEYRSRIQAKQKEAVSLQNELELLGNRAAQTELELQAVEEEQSAIGTEIRVLDLRIQALNRQLARERESIAAILIKLDTYDNDLTLQLLFGNDSFAELFDRLQALDNMTSDLASALNRAKSEKQQVTLARAEKDAKQQQLTELARLLEDTREDLQHQQEAKNVLLAESQESEIAFRQLLADLREEEASISHQILSLQGKIEARLLENDALGGSSILSWPVEPLRGISAGFHDPTYPFRNLFEHPGIDLPTRVGTPVRAAAPGYVAWTRTGVQYGYYIMVIHADGVATLYAHLSKMDVKADQFVARGEVIGYSGGARGAAGAGLSTGPHLHFEVRKDGVPTNPMGYLIQRDDL